MDSDTEIIFYKHTLHSIWTAVGRLVLDSSSKVMAHGDAREGKWRGNYRMQWVASALHTTSEHGVSSITTGDAHTSAASSRLHWRPRRFKWKRPFRRKTKSGFCACTITFQPTSTHPYLNTAQVINVSNRYLSKSYDSLFYPPIPVTVSRANYSLQTPYEMLQATWRWVTDYWLPVAYPGILFGGGFNNFSWGQRERGSGVSSPLVRSSGGSCNLAQEISFHIVKFS